MMPSPKVYGWCPGALRPMMSGDGLVVRIRAPLGKLTPKQGVGIAALSQTCGNGLLDLSARANLQLRGVREDAHETLLTGLRDLNLLDSDSAAEARRNVLVQPFWTHGDDTHCIARALAEALTNATDLTLPGKFGFAVDCGPEPVLQEISADIRIERAASGLILRADGAKLGRRVCSDSAAEAAVDLARWFVASGGVTSGRGRMKPFVAKGTALPTGHDLFGVTTVANMRPGLTPSGSLVALEFGQIHANDFAAIAAISPLRLTPWRMILLEDGEATPEITGVIRDPADPRLTVSACTGAPGCPQARAETRQIARDLATRLPAGQTLHVSGCPKGCAHPTPASLTLTGTGPNTYDLIRRGTAADRPDRTALTATDLRTAPDLLTSET